MQINTTLKEKILQAPYKPTFTKWNSYYQKRTMDYMWFFIHANDYVLVAEQTNGELNMTMLQSGKPTHSRPDVIVFLFTLHDSDDIQNLLVELKQYMHINTKLFFAGYNHFWEPFINFAEYAGFKHKKVLKNWLTKADIKNILSLEGIEIYHSTSKILLPFNIPGLSFLFNNIIANLPFFNAFALNQYCFAKYAAKEATEIMESSVSIIIPARNESDNIAEAIKQMPRFGAMQEIIFVEGWSTDDTWHKIQQLHATYTGPFVIKILQQSGKGKGNAVQEGFRIAEGDILMILDADLTVPPADLPKFYNAIVAQRGGFINGSRLIYGMEQNAMRGLNLLGNKAFSLLFSWLLGQPIKDTLCGTKVISRLNYEKLETNRSYFGNFDPFGDFDLIFGSYKLGLKIIDLPIHYKARVYGQTNISRWKHGWLLLKMWFFALRKIKYKF